MTDKAWVLIYTARGRRLPTEDELFDSWDDAWSWAIAFKQAHPKRRVVVGNGETSKEVTDGQN